MTKKLVVVVDAQNDFMQPDGLLSVPGADVVIGRIDEYLANLNPAEVAGVVFTYDTHTQPAYDNSEEGKQFPPHCIAETSGWELAVNRELVHNDIPIYSLKKGVFDMWQEEYVVVTKHNNPGDWEFTRDNLFNSFKHGGLAGVELVGVCSDVCVEQAAKGFVDRGWNVSVVRDCVRGIAEQIDEVVEKRLPTVRIV